MNTRITNIRKYFHLTMEAFGARIGLTKAMVSRMESGKNTPTERTILGVCREFGVNEHWLRTGEGEMFQQNSKSILDRLTEEYQITDRERSILTAFLKLNDNDRSAIMKYVDTIVTELAESNALPANAPKTVSAPPETVTTPPTNQQPEIAELRCQLQELAQQNQKLQSEIEAIKQEDAEQEEISQTASTNFRSYSS